MELIKITFFVLGSFFGIENSRIAAEKVTVTINPQTKTITIIQENIFTVIQSEKDSLAIAEELNIIYKDNWVPEFDDYSLKTLEFYTDKNNLLNAKITLKYTNFKDLKEYAIDVNQQANYSLIHIPSWNLQTNDGQHNGNYWNFNAGKPFTFTLEAFKNIPEKYATHKKSIYSIWKNRNDKN